MSTDLWPDFQIESERGTRQMLVEAGKGLEEKTKGVIQFRVNPAFDDLDGSIRYDCDLYVPSMRYAYPLFAVETRAVPFPAKIHWDHDVIEAHDENQLRKTLARIFHAEDTKAAVVNIVQNFGS